MAWSHHTILRVSRALERATLGLALAALVFRASWYWQLPAPPGAAYGRGDVIDFTLGLLLFFLAALTATSGLMLALHGPRAEAGAAWRPPVVGMTTFTVYYFLHPLVPRLL